MRRKSLVPTPLTLLFAKLNCILSELYTASISGLLWYSSRLPQRSQALIINKRSFIFPVSRKLDNNAFSAKINKYIYAPAECIRALQEGAVNTLDYKSKIEKAYDNSAAGYNAIASRRMKSCALKLFSGFQVSENPTVLDLGCGTGLATFLFFKTIKGKGNFYGIDLSDRMIDVAITRAEELGLQNVKFSKGDAEELDFPKSSFDLVYSNQMFHWIKDKAKMLREVFRVLKPTGQVALNFQGFPSFREVFEAFDKVKQHYPKYSWFEKPKNLTLEETRELLKVAGFRINRVFATHKVIYLNAALFFGKFDLPTLPWEIDITPERFKKIQLELATELLKTKPENPLKTNICTIFAYAQKIK